jgi:hypothetical protein
VFTILIHKKSAHVKARGVEKPFITKTLSLCLPPAKMPSPDQLHNHIEHLQALLAAAATNSSNHYEPSAIGNYEIRSCLRQIQATLMRPAFEFFGQRQHDSVTIIPHDDASHHVVVDDLMTLLTLNDYHEHQDGMELLDSLVPRAVELVMASQLSLTDDHLQLLLPRILHLVSDKDNVTTTSSSARLECLLGLLNQHLTALRLEQVLEEDEDIWIALKLLLLALIHRPRRPPQQGFRSLRFITDPQESSIEPELHELAGVLLDYWKAKIMDSKSSLNEWLQRHLISLQAQEESYFSQQHDQSARASTTSTVISRRDYAIPEDLGRHVDECSEMVEQYGADLLETALQLLEEGAHSPQQEHHDDESAGLFITLKYSTLATNWIVLLGEDFPSVSNLTRSLWRALEAFIVERLEDESCSIIPEEVDIQMGATDNLWRLTQIQYGSMHEQDISIVVLTIFRLWRHANYYWTPATQEWVQSHLLSPNSSKYNTLIRRALQVGLLSITYFPEQQTNPEDTLVLSSLADLVFTDEPDTNDPWQSIVYEQLAEYSVQMEQQMRET